LIIVDASVVVDLLIKPPAEVAPIKARLAGERFSHVPHLLDVEVTHALRLSAYDAVYVAMAEATGATLLTRDGRLAQAAGHRARIELV
jgi:predicted nucleic acid-binding protein